MSPVSIALKLTETLITAKLSVGLGARFSTRLTSSAVVSYKILASFIVKLLSLLKYATTSNICAMYDLRYDDGHLHVMFFLNNVVFHKL